MEEPAAVGHVFASGERWPLTESDYASSDRAPDRFQSVGRRIIAALLMANGLRDVAISLQGAHLNLFWFPLMHSSLIPGAMFLAVGVGIWNAWGWSRWCCGLLALLSWISLGVVGPIVGIFILKNPEGMTPITWMLLLAVPSGALAIYSFMPSTRKNFAEVRAARARGREARRDDLSALGPDQFQTTV